LGVPIKVFEESARPPQGGKLIPHVCRPGAKVPVQTKSGTYHRLRAQGGGRGQLSQKRRNMASGDVHHIISGSALTIATLAFFIFIARALS
jgi:hypothetical protein